MASWEMKELAELRGTTIPDSVPAGDEGPLLALYEIVDECSFLDM